MTDEQLETTVDFAREIVTSLVPKELVLFPAVSREFARNPAAAAKRVGGTAGILAMGDAAATFLSPAILLASWEVVKFMAQEVAKEITRDVAKDLGKQSADFISRRLRSMFQPEADDRLTPAQLKQVQVIVATVCGASKLSEAQRNEISSTIERLLSQPAKA